MFHNTKENHQTTRKETKRRRKDRRRPTKQPENKKQNGNKYIPINNYFKCKLNKYSNQKI